MIVIFFMFQRYFLGNHCWSIEGLERLAMLITLDLDGVLMKNPFSTAVFPSLQSSWGKARPIAQEVMTLIRKR